MRHNAILKDVSFYWQWPALAQVYIDESLVLGIHESDQEIAFDMSYALIKGHEHFVPPAHGGHYCHRRGKMRFSDFESRHWRSRDFGVFAPNGSRRGDGIIAFFCRERTSYTLYGDWGNLRIDGGDLTVTFD